MRSCLRARALLLPRFPVQFLEAVTVGVGEGPGGLGDALGAVEDRLDVGVDARVVTCHRLEHVEQRGRDGRLELLGDRLGREAEREDGGVGAGLDGLHRAVVFPRGRLEAVVAGLGQRRPDLVGDRSRRVGDDGDVSGRVRGGEQRVEAHAFEVGAGRLHRVDRPPHDAGHVYQRAVGPAGVGLDGRFDGRYRHGDGDHVEAFVRVGRDRSDRGLLEGVGGVAGDARVGVGEGDRRRVGRPGDEGTGEPPPHLAGADHEQVHAAWLLCGLPKAVRSPVSPSGPAVCHTFPF
ncbi:hypothetical protein ACFQL4_12790 [Halosimplex aquaticum]